ncbi:MAG: LemA family protein [Gammaproteobacteria bacterium]|nr:LemA family protein [Gammaproteobacteria bacterium]
MTFGSLLKNPKLKAAFIVIGVGLVIYLLTGSWLSKINFVEKSIHTYWGILKQDTERRAQMLPKFSQLIQAYSPQAEHLQQILVKAYQDNEALNTKEIILKDPEQYKTFLAVQNEIVNALLIVQQQASHDETLAQNRQFLMLKMELLNIEKQIQYDVYFLNREIASYNGFLTGYPERWVNQLFLGKKLNMAIEVPTVKDTLGQ